MRISGTVSEEQRQLTDRLAVASEAYYVKNLPLMTDEAFDMELKKLQQMERRTGVALPYSPTLRVGSDLQDGFGKVRHPVPMLTIENTYNDEELRDWVTGIIGSSNGAVAFTISPKYDGVSLELHYSNGVLVSASTRGDKTVGDDVTANARTVKDIPLRVQGLKGDVFIRGEVLMPKSVLAELNRTAEKPFANTRNACAGSLKQLNPAVTASRNLIFRAWDAYMPGEDGLQSHYERMLFLSQQGFKFEEGTMPERIVVGEGGIRRFCTAVTEWKEEHLDGKVDWDYDGIVVKLDMNRDREDFNRDAHRAIGWGIARKWNEERACITRIQRVDFFTGRTGHITPVAVLDPVQCDGVTISNVILPNESYIRKFDLHVNDYVEIVRSGGVIPKVVGKSSYEDWCRLTSPDSTPGPNPYAPIGIEFPTVCPDCGAPLEKNGEIWECPNRQCPAQTVRRLMQWCAKDCMNIEGMGESTADDLVSKNIAVEPFDLYDMATNQRPGFIASQLGEGYGERSVKKLFDEIKKSMSKPLECIIYGMSIDGIGKRHSKRLAQHFKSLKAIIAASEDELAAIEDFGPVKACNVRAFMQEEGEYWLNMLEHYGMATVYAEGQDEAQMKGEALKGVQLVFTGKSRYWEGDMVEAVLESYGAKCGHSVSKKLTCLVTGDNPGPAKVSKARDLGLTILTEDEFLDTYGVPRPSKEEPVRDPSADYIPDPRPAGPTMKSLL